MKNHLVFILICSISFSFNAYAQNHEQSTANEYTSEYAGQELREIKSLSKDDIDQLRAGSGWGLAKAAELNGVPGPSHILDMKKEIGLSLDQESKIQAIFDDMQSKAIDTGIKLIEKEKELNQAFVSKEISEERLKKMTLEIGNLRGELTFIHLVAHLEAAEILSKEQIIDYNKLRGYTTSSFDPCNSIPDGHNPEMWKKHNNCGN